MKPTVYKILDVEIARYERPLMDTIDTLHGFLTGSGGDAQWSTLDQLAGFVNARLKDWQLVKGQNHPQMLYDSAVYNLGVAVLLLYAENCKGFKRPVPFRLMLEG